MLGPASAQRAKAAEDLLATSDYYFDNKKIGRDERLEILRQLLPLVTDEDPIVRRAVAHIAGLLKVWSEDITLPMSDLLSDNDVDVRITAVWACGSIGSLASACMPTLTALATDDESGVRWRVAWTLSQIATPDRTAFDCAGKLMEDTDSLVRMYALDAFTASTDDLSEIDIDRVIAMLDDPELRVAASAARALSRIGDKRPSTISVLREIVSTHGSMSTLDVVHCLTVVDENVLDFPPARAWLEENEGYWWVDDLLEKDI